MEGDGTYPWLPAQERQALIDTPLEAKWSAIALSYRIGFGSTCIENQIIANVIRLKISIIYWLIELK